MDLSEACEQAVEKEIEWARDYSPVDLETNKEIIVESATENVHKYLDEDESFSWEEIEGIVSRIVERKI